MQETSHVLFPSSLQHQAQSEVSFQPLALLDDILYLKMRNDLVLRNYPVQPRNTFFTGSENLTRASAVGDSLV